MSQINKSICSHTYEYSIPRRRNYNEPHIYKITSSYTTHNFIPVTQIYLHKKKETLKTPEKHAY